MGDKSPKSNRKQAAQKKAKTDAVQHAVQQKKKDSEALRQTEKIQK